ncbi:MAG: hypothetical protein VR71_10130 [Roseovarius sp. BRH_c41]|uniref:DUF5658 family protein n=1 Tax=Roseovarius sp. BRH_c41 TaxID=1629709 RepID=UPI0005F15F6F|nr:DUF5658 family protein [Roseovarius sp. BRH_c41]KJS43545.1 MAG: hypothetical protein VR71_10130 [Roseovarius sp. BRH_c41]
MSELVFIWAVYLLAQFADVASTRAALRGGLVEANPLMARLMGLTGNWWAVKLGVALAAGILLTWLGQERWIMLLAAITGGVAVNNWRLVRKHRERR